MGDSRGAPSPPAYQAMLRVFIRRSQAHWQRLDPADLKAREQPRPVNWSTLGFTLGQLWSTELQHLFGTIELILDTRAWNRPENLSIYIQNNDHPKEIETLSLINRLRCIDLVFSFNTENTQGISLSPTKSLKYKSWKCYGWAKGLNERSQNCY